MKNKRGQLNKILIIVLVLLLGITIITAQNAGEKTQQQTQENINSQLVNISEKTEAIDNIPKTVNLCENMNCGISALLCPDNSTILCENSCNPETGVCTSCSLRCEEREEIEENLITGNETQENENIILPETESNIIRNDTISPKLEIQLLYPTKATRGELAEIKAIITNSGVKAEKVKSQWILPENLEIISGKLIEDCGNLNPEESCTSIIKTKIPLSALLGKNQIKIIVNYEK